MPEKNDINLDAALTSEITVHQNLGQEIIVTNTDKVKLLLIEHHRLVKLKMDWVTPLGIFITILATLLTANFDKTLFGVTKEMWQSIFIVACIVSGFYTAKYAIRAAVDRKKGTVDDFLEKIKINNK